MLFLTVALVHLIALMSPGPDFFFVSQTAASRSHREAMMAVVGISLGIMVWAGVALMGLHLSVLDGLSTAAFGAGTEHAASTGGASADGRAQLSPWFADQPVKP